MILAIATGTYVSGSVTCVFPAVPLGAGIGPELARCYQHRNGSGGILAHHIDCRVDHLVLRPICFRSIVYCSHSIAIIQWNRNENSRNIHIVCSYICRWASRWYPVMPSYKEIGCSETRLRLSAADWFLSSMVTLSRCDTITDYCHVPRAIYIMQKYLSGPVTGILRCHH